MQFGPDIHPLAAVYGIQEDAGNGCQHHTAQRRRKQSSRRIMQGFRRAAQQIMQQDRLHDQCKHANHARRANAGHPHCSRGPVKLARAVISGHEPQYACPKAHF